MTNNNETGKPEQTYEEMIVELREIAKKLDDTETSVEEAVKLHARGMELVARCEMFLEKAQMTVTEVSSQFSPKEE